MDNALKNASHRSMCTSLGTGACTKLTLKRPCIQASCNRSVTHGANTIHSLLQREGAGCCYSTPARRISVPSISNNTKGFPLAILYYSGQVGIGSFSILSMEYQFPQGKTLGLVLGDITTIHVDAIVNAANSELEVG